MRPHKIRQFDLDEFTRAYLETALWSSNDESTPSGGYPLDLNYSIEDIADSSIAAALEDCAKFQRENSADLVTANYLRHQPFEKDTLSRAGHDFWLTRHGHGAGFWDGDWREAAGERLTEACKKYREICPVVGDDGKIYFE